MISCGIIESLSFSLSFFDVADREEFIDNLGELDGRSAIDVENAAEVGEGVLLPTETGS